MQTLLSANNNLNAKGNTHPDHFQSQVRQSPRVTAGIVEKGGRWRDLPIDLGIALGDSLVLNE
jgi:hypothetical protein